MSRPIGNVTRQMQPREAPAPPKDYEDEYRKLQIDFNEVKKARVAQEDHIKIMTTKLRKLETYCNQLSTGVAGAVRPPSHSNKDQDQLVDQLLTENKKLKAQCAALAEKNSGLMDALQKKEREVAIAKKVAAQYRQKSQAGTKENMPISQDIEVRPTSNPSLLGTKRTSSEALGAAAAPDANLLELAKSYKTRLTAAEAQIKQLRDELARKGTAAGGAGFATSSAPMSGISGDLESQLRDANWKLQQLQTQYDYLKSKTSMQGSAYKQSEEQMDDYAAKVRELRRALEDLRHEKDLVETKASRADELEEIVRDLRQTNRSLEDKISRLCLSDERAKYDKADSAEYSKDKETMQQQINHLQEAVRTKHAALAAIVATTDKLRAEREEAVRRADDMKERLEELGSNSSTLQQKMRLYSGDDGINLDELERALTLVRRRAQAAESLPFLESADGDEMLTLPIVKKKLEQTQMMNLQLNEEVERLNGLYKMSAKINKDFQQEFESMNMKKDKDKLELKQQMEDFEELARRRLETIHKLNAQVRELTYGLTSKKKGGKLSPGKVAHAANLEDSFAGESEADNVLLSDLIDEKGGEAPLPFENLLEVWVKGATLRDGLMPPGASSFVIIDFFDYESQTTSLQFGTKPMWDFAATYKINVDDFLIRYLATDVITLELCMACQGDYTLLGRCSIPVSALLKSKPSIHLKNHPMLSVSTGEILAHVTIDLKLAMPIAELYKLFLERHPMERKQIEDIVSKRAMEAVGAIEKAKTIDAIRAGVSEEDESRLYNELEVIVIKATGLPKAKDGSAPCPYVYFQLLGHPEKFTNPSTGSTDPNFNEQFGFPLITNDQQLRLLQRSKLELTVVDMKGEETADDESEGLIGDVSVSLADLADGNRIADIFSIKNAAGKKVGELQLSVKWKYTFRRQRELGPRSLSGVEVETLISAFSAGELKEGIIDYKAFCRFINPPLEIRGVLDKLRMFCRRVSDTEHRSARSIFSSLAEVNSVTMDTFCEKMLQYRLDITPVDIKTLFAFIDMDGDGHITIDQFLAVASLDDSSTIPAAIQEKLRERAVDLEARNIPVSRLFKDAEQWGDQGLVTRLEFKGVLKRMGFDLVDDVEPVSLSSKPAPFSLRKPEPAGLGEDMLNDSMGSNDEVLVHSEVARQGRPPSSAKKSIELNAKQKEIFEERKADLQKRSAEALQLQQATVSKSVSDPFQSEHRVAVSKQDVSKSYDKGTLDEQATKLQAAVRGHQIRKKGLDESVDSDRVTGIAMPKKIDVDPLQLDQAVFGDPAPSTSPVDIMDAEEAVRSCLQALQGNRAAPNLLSGFQTVDTKRAGTVNRKQFAYVISQYPSVKLQPKELRALMDFFDTSSDGSEIDYSAFVKMTRFQKSDLLPAVDKLDKMIFASNIILKFRAFDSAGTGFLRRQDMLRVLADLGYGQVSNAAILSMLELFETRVDGQVNYNNFIEYVRESSASKALDALAAKLYEMISNGRAIDEAAARTWYKRMDQGSNGKVSLQEFLLFLDASQLVAAKEVSTSLYVSLDRQGSGVSFGDFSAWLRSYPDESQKYSALYTSLTVAEVQRKANKYMLAVAAAAPTRLDDITQSYLVYDWQKSSTNALSEKLFAAATKRAGFPLTCNELKLVVMEFSKAGSSGARKVSYRKFLAWATPGQDIGASVKASVTEISAPGRKTASSIVLHLEKCLKRGDDLLSIFGRYDSIKAGRISADEFCSGLSEVGMSSATLTEVLEVADRFKAAVGDFVLYRKIISELMRNLDDDAGASDIDVLDVIKSGMARAQVDLRRLRDLFEYYDRKGLGKVREEDVGTIFSESKVSLRRQELTVINDRYGMNSSGWISYPNLLSALENRFGDRAAKAKVALSVQVPEELVSKVKDFLEKLIVSGKDFRAEFDKFDDSYSGSVPQSDFREVMQERLRSANPNLTTALSTREIELLERAYKDASDAKRVSFAKMIFELHPHSTGGDRPGESTLEIAEELRQKIRRKCEYQTPGELRSPFKHFARRKGEPLISKDDLGVAVSALGLRLAADQLDALFDFMNISGGRAINYSDFVVFVCDAQHSDVIWKLKRTISRASTSEREIVNALNEEDRGSSGLVTIKQLAKALKTCGIDLSDSDAARLMMQFDTDEAQRLDVEMFGRFLRSQTGESRVGGEGARGAVSASTDDSETQAWNSLKKRVEAKLESGFSQREVFGIFDVDGNDVLDLVNFQQGARTIGATLSKAEARSILRRMSLLVGGVVDKNTFFEALGLGRGKAHDARSAASELDDYDRPKEKDSGSMSVDRIAEIIASQVEKNCGRDEPADYLRRALKKQSDSADRLTRKDLARAINSLDIAKLGAAEVDRLFDFLDSADRGSVDVRKVADKVFSGGSSDSYKEREEESSSRRSGSGRVRIETVYRKRPDLKSEVVRNLSRIREASKFTIDDLASDLKKADRDGAGFLERNDFIRVLTRFGFKLEREVERDMGDTFGEGEPGIYYADFVDATKVEMRSSSSKDGTADEYIDAIKKKISRDLKKGSDPDAIFDRLDRNHDGQLDMDELESGLEKMGIALSRDDVKRVLSKFGSSRSNSVDYKEFVRFCMPKSFSQDMEREVSDIVDRIRRSLEDNLGSGAQSARRIKETFADCDLSGDGAVDMNEFIKAMNVLKVKLRPRDAELIYERYDVDGNGKFDYNEFMSLIGFKPVSGESKRSY